MSGSGRGPWLVFAAAFFWGTSATLARFVFRDHDVPALTAVALRLAIAVALLGAWLALRRPGSLAVDRRDFPYLIVLGLLGVAAIQGSYYYSISVLGVGLAIVIQYLAPSMIVLYELLRGRPPDARTLLVVAAALAGTVLLVGGIAGREVRATPLQWAIGFSSAVTFAFYIVFSKRGIARYRSETILFYTFLIAAVFWCCVTPPWQIARAGYSRQVWAMFLMLGVFSTLVPFTLFYSGLRHMRPTEASIVATSEPVIAALSAALFLGEGLRPIQWGGAALVLIASILSSIAAPPPSAAEHPA